MRILYCDYNPNDNLYYCSLKKYSSLYPDQCIFILDHDKLFNYIKTHQEEYCYSLPILVKQEFEYRLKKLT